MITVFIPIHINNSYCYYVTTRPPPFRQPNGKSKKKLKKVQKVIDLLHEKAYLVSIKGRGRAPPTKTLTGGEKETKKVVDSTSRFWI